MVGNLTELKKKKVFENDLYNDKIMSFCYLFCWCCLAPEISGLKKKKTFNREIKSVLILI